jgi:hypothetical protein
MVYRRTNHGTAREILHKEVVPALEELERGFRRWAESNERYQPLLKKTRTTLERARVAELLLRQGG